MSYRALLSYVFFPSLFGALILVFASASFSMDLKPTVQRRFVEDFFTWHDAFCVHSMTAPREQEPSEFLFSPRPFSSRRLRPRTGCLFFC